MLRSSIIEDLGCTWFKKQLALLPVPAELEPQIIGEMTKAGDTVLNADMDLANSHRHVDKLIAAGGGRTLYEMIAFDDPRTRTLDMNTLSPDPVPVAGLRDNGAGELISDSLLFRFPVGDDELRKYLTYVVGRLLDEKPKLEMGRDDFGELMIPDNLPEVVAEIERLERTNLKQTFFEALDRLDEVVGRALGMAREDVDYIRSEMTTNGFLRELRPMLEQRGLRVQPYADDSTGDSYS